MTQTATAPQSPSKTCSTCPYFASRMDGSTKGWCHLFDQFARSTHATTQDCINRGGLQEDTDIAGYFEERTAEQLSAQEWEAAQDELLNALEEQVRAITPDQVQTIEEDTATLRSGEIIHAAPEPIIKLSDNLYRVLSSEGTHRYAVNTRKRTCTCVAGSYSRNCKHLKQADAVEAEEFKTWCAESAKVPAGWRLKSDGWWHNHHGHRTNVMPVTVN